VLNSCNSALDFKKLSLLHMLISREDGNGRILSVLGIPYMPVRAIKGSVTGSMVLLKRPGGIRCNKVVD